MKKTILTLSCIATLILAGVSFTTPGCSSDHPGDTDTTGVDTTGIPVSYATLPLDINAMSQASADTFSWLSFIALNWPADGNTCTADTSKKFGSGGPVVWETYLSSDQIFVDTNSQPASWCANANAVTAMAHLPESVQELARKTGINRFIHMDAKVDDPHELDQASGGPLVDQNGRFARYEIRVNEDEYNYIHKNSLWSKKGQSAFLKTGDTISFPQGPTQYGPAGAMEVKAAWKVLGAGDDTTKFYTIRAIVYNDEQGDPSPGPNPVTLGLVGLHIAHKTATQRMWVWSTFEHVDNLTTSFYNAACKDCPVNTPITGSPDELDSLTGKPLHQPTQVTRVNAVDLPDVAGINKHFQGMLKETVWANYELIGTQWMFFEEIIPDYLANSVQETYLQGPHPASYGYKDSGIITDKYYFEDPRYKPFSSDVSSSCVGCHYKATVPVSAKRPESDFSYLLGNAQ
jgi:hypothetical protein